MRGGKVERGMAGWLAGWGEGVKIRKSGSHTAQDFINVFLVSSVHFHVFLDAYAEASHTPFSWC